MREYFKGTASVLAAAMFLLCPAPAVFATEEPAGDTAIVSAPEAGASGIRETVSGNVTGTASVTESSMERVMKPAMKPATQPKTAPAAEPDTASTQEELLAWLKNHERGEGTLKLTADIFLDDLLYMNASRKNITVDTGDFSIVAVGEVSFWCSGLTVRGHGGEKGVLRAARGGAFSIGHMSVVAEEGFAVFQEEGAGLAMTQCALSGNAVHYAETPFVWSFRSPLVIVGPGQTVFDVLPGTVTSYDVNRQGRMYPEDVPVVWNLTEYESSRTQRLRFDAEGSVPGFAFLRAPVCTVIYDDFPLTFLNVLADKTERDQGTSYQFTGFFSKPEDRLPFTVSQEYSFDGENWTLYEEKLITDPDQPSNISLSAGVWDTQSFPRVFIRLGWNDNGTVYHSNVLCFTADRLEKAEDRGGNRGGGTDIVNPSGPPTPDPESPPDPEPVPQPQPSPGPETAPNLQPSPGPETAPNLQPSPGPEPMPEPQPSPNPAPTPETAHPTPGQPDGTGAGHEIKPPSHPAPDPKPAVPASEPSKDSKRLSPAIEAGEITEAAPKPRRSVKPPEISAISDSTAGAPSSAEPQDVTALAEPRDVTALAESEAAKASAETGETIASAEPADAPPGPGVLPVAAGLATVTASVGGAAFCLHPKAWKGLLRRLRSILRH